MHTKSDYISLLRMTRRRGADEVAEWLRESDFFTAPASANHHGNKEGGLLQHSLAVTVIALEMRRRIVVECPQYEDMLTEQSVLLVSLLHDVCKVNRYQPEEQTLVTHDGQIIKDKRYKVVHDSLPIGHGERSVVLLLQHGLQLTDEEILAIRWHMGPWEVNQLSDDAKTQYQAAIDRSPLLALLQAADMLASVLYKE